MRGIPRRILLRGDTVEEAFTDGSFPVGLVPEAESRSTLQLEPDDTMVLFSDGVTEAMDPADQMFGDSRLSEVLPDIMQRHSTSFRKTILESIETFIRGASPADDITLLLVRYRAAVQAQSS